MSACLPSNKILKKLFIIARELNEIKNYAIYNHIFMLKIILFTQLVQSDLFGFCTSECVVNIRGIQISFKKNVNFVF